MFEFNKGKSEIRHEERKKPARGAAFNCNYPMIRGLLKSDRLRSGPLTSATCAGQALRLTVKRPDASTAQARVLTPQHQQVPVFPGRRDAPPDLVEKIFICQTSKRSLKCLVDVAAPS
ncbi:MAG: hypothetical protein Q8O29_08090 [Polaromonas sp.]|nr:hypothetical protein [Polaromonas sp.]